MLEYQNISLIEKKELYIDDLSLNVPDGAILCLVGGDHRARSLLMEVGTGNRKPDSGRVLIGGMDVFEVPEQLYSSIGYMTGLPGNYHDIKVYEYYEMILSLYRIRGRNRRKRIEEVLSLLSLEDYGDLFVEDIPADSMPLFSLGTAILHQPDLLFLNQPFSGLDAEGRAGIVNILLDLHEKGVSMVLNTEMYPDLLGFITDIAVIEDGKTSMYGQVEEVYENLLRKSPVTMKILSGMNEALAVLKKESLVDRVTVKENEIIFRYRGEEREEADLLTRLVGAGVLVQSYTRDRIRINEMFRG